MPAVIGALAVAAFPKKSCVLLFWALKKFFSSGFLN
jgi:hypothetical protein